MNLWYRFLALIAMALLMTACGRVPDEEDTGGTDTGTDTGTGTGVNDDGTVGIGDGTREGVSYLPLSFYLQHAEYWEDAADSFVIDTDADSFYIWNYMIQPIHSFTREAITTATIEDYSIIEDGEEIEAEEQFPTLNRVASPPINLLTAIIVDGSLSVADSSDIDVDEAALIAEIKEFITLAQASDDPSIANQQFVVWQVGEFIEDDSYPNEFCCDVTNMNYISQGAVNLADRNFTTDSDVVDDALDAVSFGHYDSNLYMAVVKAIGMRIEALAGFQEIGELFFFDGNNDLYDFVGADGIQLGNVLLFSKGGDVGDVSREDYIKALESQVTLRYDTNPVLDEVDLEGSGNELNDDDEEQVVSSPVTQILKPVIYLTPVSQSNFGDSEQFIADNAEAVIQISQTGNYDFAEDIIAAQQAAISARVDQDSVYMVRSELGFRTGNHTREFTSASSNGGYNYTLGVELIEMNGGTVPLAFCYLDTVLELMGPNEEYLSNLTISRSEFNRVYAHTLWTNTEYQANDYNWSGTAAFVDNNDGSINLTGNGTITLTNTNPQFAAARAACPQVAIPNTNPIQYTDRVDTGITYTITD